MRRLGCTGGLVLFFIAAVVVSSLAGGGEPGQGGVKDTDANGHRALFVLLGELGFEPGVFEGSPKELAESGRGLVILPSLPGAPADGSEAWESSFDPKWYATFMARGGVLVVPVATWNDLEFLKEGLSYDEGELDLGLGERSRRWELAGPKGSEFELVTDFDPLLLHSRELPPGTGVFGPQPSASAGLGETASAALSMPWGKGQLVVLGGPSAFQNKLLVEADNALVFVRLLEFLGQAPGHSSRILFDQSPLLQDQERSWVGLLFHMPLLPATLAVILGLCFWAWSFSARRSFPLDRRQSRRPPPAERARALAGLVSRAGHPDWLETPSDGPNHD